MRLKKLCQGRHFRELYDEWYKLWMPINELDAVVIHIR